MTNKKKFGIHIIAKAAIPNWCNTRLAVDLGSKRAAELQKVLIYDVVRHTKSLQESHDVILWVGLPDIMMMSPPEKLKVGIEVYARPFADLRNALFYASREGWNRNWDYALYLGVDAPYAVSQYLHQAIENLDKAKAILGPTEDGGVYLIGLPRNRDVIFRGVNWGSSKVCQQLFENAKEYGLSCESLPKASDIDTKKDLDQLYAILQSDREIAPYTHDFLHQWKNQN